MALSEQQLTDESAKRNAMFAQTAEIAGKGQFANVNFGKLYRSGNVRTDATKRLPDMIESYKRYGFKSNHPIVVSKKSDGRFLVLCGNRRTEALELILKSDKALFERIVPNGTIPAVVHENLTETQEALLMLDHGKDEDRVPLDSAGEFFLVDKLVKAGFDTQAGIAERMGWTKVDKKTKVVVPNRSKVQPYVNLSRLPVFIKTEFITLLRDGLTATNVRMSQIGQPPAGCKDDKRFAGGLSGVYNREFAQYPDGNGPILTELWGICNLPVEAKPAAPTMLKASEIESRLKTSGSAIIRGVLRIVLGYNDGKTFVDYDADAVKAEAAVCTLSDISAHIGEDEFNTLIAEISGSEDSTEVEEIEDEAEVTA